MRIGEIKLDQAIVDYNQQLANLNEQFYQLTKVATSLQKECEQYQDYASDADERELIIDSKNSLKVVKTTASPA